MFKAMADSSTSDSNLKSWSSCETLVAGEFSEDICHICKESENDGFISVRDKKVQAETEGQSLFFVQS